MLQVRENESSLRKWSGGTINLLRCELLRENWLQISLKTWPTDLPYPAVGHDQTGGIEGSNTWIYLDVTKMSIWIGQRKSLLGRWNWGGMPPDNPKLTSSFRSSLFYITHDLYHYDLMTLLKNVCTHHWVVPRKGASKRAQCLLRPTLVVGISQKLLFFCVDMSVTGSITSALHRVSSAVQNLLFLVKCIKQQCMYLYNETTAVVFSMKSISYVTLSVEANKCKDNSSCSCFTVLVPRVDEGKWISWTRVEQNLVQMTK